MQRVSRQIPSGYVEIRQDTCILTKTSEIHQDTSGYAQDMYALIDPPPKSDRNSPLPPTPTRRATARLSVRVGALGAGALILGFGGGGGLPLWSATCSTIEPRTRVGHKRVGGGAARD